MARERAAKEAEAPPRPPMTDAERAELDDLLDRLVAGVTRGWLANGSYFLVWTQLDDNNKAVMMQWHPETPDELRRAGFLYDAAHGLGAFTKLVPNGKPVRRSAEETALIEGILQNRDDETGYLVYADYLTEQGDSQGDYIRLCVEIDKMAPDHPDYEARNRQRGSLVSTHAEEWYAPLGALGLRPKMFGRFVPLWLSLRHGVIEQVTIDRPGILPGAAARLFAAAPFLRKLEFAKGHLNPAGLAKVKQLSQIEELDLSSAEITAADLTALLRSKHLTNLKTLNVASNAIGDAGAAALASWPGLARLESLDVSSCDLQTEGVRVLATSPRIANLTRLRAGRNQGGEAHSLLLTTPYLKRLQELELRGIELDRRAALCLNSAVFKPTLTHFDLNSATFTDDAFERFANCPLPVLRRLTLNNVNLRLPAASQLAKASFTATLEELYLDNCHLGMASANFFYQGKFPRLKTLNVSRNRIERYGIEMLAGRARAFPALTNLGLCDNRLGPNAVVHLAASKLLANLTDVDLSGNKIGVIGALALANSKHLKKLTSLVVDEKAVTKKGKTALLDRFGESAVSFR